ncbi:hypothetical protein [Campylobacter cuniculorum]|uniref:Flagellar biosynthesis protein n=2 Tax=Campylobacter cuniculorum TaxID=374106 RepID=A0A1W6BW87_9BACT|nr:hypothetical protein [Campylobacter cuniculorum]ARJ56363.1 hypothetical protein CCUN_0745 [Campylobacter cuniculorum DSM 23162 = LMG 24588]QOR03851.1 hypothetical protein A0071_06645 [Campylobacter cuniculorum]
MEYLLFLTIIIIFLFIVFLITMRYERKIKLLNQNIQNLKEHMSEIESKVIQNRTLIEKNRANIEDISKQ